MNRLVTALWVASCVCLCVAALLGGARPAPPVTAIAPVAGDALAPRPVPAGHVAVKMDDSAAGVGPAGDRPGAWAGIDRSLLDGPMRRQAGGKASIMAGVRNSSDALPMPILPLSDPANSGAAEDSAGWGWLDASVRAAESRDEKAGRPARTDDRLEVFGDAIPGWREYRSGRRGQAPTGE